MKHTPWFPANVKPVRAGVYEVRKKPPWSWYRYWIRWWDGEFWSVPCFKGEKPWSIKLSAGIKDSQPLGVIEWTERPASWPERSRT